MSGEPPYSVEDIVAESPGVTLGDIPTEQLEQLNETLAELNPTLYGTGGVGGGGGPVVEGPLAYYPFDDGTFDDDTGVTYTGEGSPFTDSGRSGSAIELSSGNPGYVRADTSGDELTPSGAAFTIAAWVYPVEEDGTGDQIVRRDESAGGGFLYNLRLNPDRTIRLEYDRQTDTDTFTITSNSTETSIPGSKWTHVAAVISASGGATIYIDGEPVEGISEEPLDDYTFDSLAGGELSIGAFGLNGSEYFNGRIDEVYLYDRALLAAEVASLAAV